MNKKAVDGQINKLKANLAGLDGFFWLRELEKFMEKKPSWTEKELLKFISFTPLPHSGKFVVQDFFIEESFKFSGADRCFTKRFMHLNEDERGAASIAACQLQKMTSDYRIIQLLQEVNGEGNFDISVAEMLGMHLKQALGEEGVLLTNGWQNIFYIRHQRGDDSLSSAKHVSPLFGNFSAVISSWKFGGWCFDAGDISDTIKRRAARNVFFRSSPLIA